MTSKSESARKPKGTHRLTCTFYKSARRYEDAAVEPALGVPTRKGQADTNPPAPPPCEEFYWYNAVDNWNKLREHHESVHALLSAKNAEIAELREKIRDLMGES